MPNFNEYLDLDIEPEDFIEECTEDERKAMYKILVKEFGECQVVTVEKDDDKLSLADVIKEENLERLSKLDHLTIEKLVEEYKV